MMPLLYVRKLGRVDYDQALAMQKDLVAMRLRKDIPDTLLLLEHPPVFTIGRTGKRANLVGDPASIGAKVVEVDRGGDITYHGPGQLVGYPIFDLRGLKEDVKWYLEQMEAAIIRAVQTVGVTGERRPGYTGVWVNGAKLCAMGVHVARWITSHGFALNVNTDLDHFKLIIPCGIPDKPVTSLRSLLGREQDLEAVKNAVAEAFGAVFGRRVIYEQEGGRKTRSKGGQAARPR